MARKLNILWTGGWDSTFRVLDAVTKGYSIQPHYLVDRGRRSHALEFLTIGLITQKVLERYPAAQIAWPRMIEVHEVPLNSTVTEAFVRLTENFYLGGQYDWLARYAVANGITDLELCIHQHDRARAFGWEDVRRIDNDGDAYYVVPKSNSDLSTLYSHYHFPLLELSKLDMKAAAESRGFLDIMEMTWFCHSPRDGKPCGLCNPCIYTAQEGMTERLPVEALRRQRSWYRVAKRTVKKVGIGAFHFARELTGRMRQS